MKTAIALQEEYVETTLAARSRWSHRKDGGHSHRTIGAAAKRLRRGLEAWGFSSEMIALMMKDARDMVALEAAAE